MNKFIITYIMFACCSFFSFSFYESLGFKLNELPTVDTVLSKVFDETLIELRKKYPLSIIGVGGEQKDKKEIMIGASFMLNRSLSKDECRELLVDVTEELLKNINENQDLQQYLYHVPFPYKNIEIRVFLRNPDRSDIWDPDISIFSLIHGLVEYDIYDRDIPYKFSTEEETYEKALQIVQAQRSERANTTVPEPKQESAPSPELQQTEQTFFQRACKKFYDFFK